jgi:hypothetical protein
MSLAAHSSLAQGWGCRNYRLGAGRTCPDPRAWSGRDARSYGRTRARHWAWHVLQRRGRVDDCGIRRAADARSAGEAGRDRSRRARLYRPCAIRRLCGSAGFLSSRARRARRLLPRDPRQGVRAAYRRSTGRDHCCTGRRQGEQFLLALGAGLHGDTHAHHGGHVCRPDLWRQQGLCRLAPCGLSWRAASVLSGGRLQSKDAFTGAPIIGLKAQATLRR